MQFISEYELITPGCGCAQFAVLAPVREKRLKTHQDWWCPQCGSNRIFTGEPPEKKQLRDAQQQAASAQLRAAQAEAKAASVVKSYKKIRDRVKKGVCPCCNRTFGNLARHMLSKHADFGTHDQLKNIRLAYGLSQAALAEEIGVSQAHISQYERGAFNRRTNEIIDSWLVSETTK